MSSLRHDWYQTEQKVVIAVLVKNAESRNCTVDIQSQRVSVRGEDLELDFDLQHEIDASKSTFRILSVKVEITLHKLVGERWPSLTKQENATSATIQSLPKQLPVVQQSQSQTQTSPSKKDKNWDRVVKDAWEKEEIDKDEEKQLNNLFERIYSDSNPEVRRAMNKSFTESGGTVLSTNWNEVGGQKVEMKPPTGTEFRPWTK